MASQPIVDTATEIDTTQPVVTSDPNPTPTAQNDADAFYSDDDRPEDDPKAGRGDEVGGGEAGEPEPDAQPIAVPTSWSNEYKESFAKLPRDLQEVVSRRESERERFVHQKSQEAAQTRQSVEAEARQVLAQMHQNHAQQYEQALSFLNMPQPPDARLLSSDDPNDHRLYMVQQNRYQATAAQQQQLQQSAEASRQQAMAIQSHEQQLAIQENEAKLVAKWPEWSQPSERAKLVERLQPIAAELGYGAEAQANASAEDFFALDMAHAWKVKADKYDALMKQKMAPVRAAKQLPPTARTGAPVTGGRQSMDAASLLYPDDQPRR